MMSEARQLAVEPASPVGPPLDPLCLKDFKKGIMVPKEHFEPWLERFDWTYHQLARGELPPPFESVEDFQLACICEDRFLWCTAFLRDPEDPDHDEPYSFWDFQVESLRYEGNVIHKDAAEIGKTREIVALAMYFFCTVPNGSGLIGAPQQTHLEEIIEGMDDQFTWNPDLGRMRRHRRIKDGWRKHPHHAFYGRNGFKIDFRPSGFDGQAYRGVHARTFAIKDEAAKDKNVAQWSEFWRAMKPGCVARIYSVPDGDRSCEFYRLGQRAAMTTPKNEVKVKVKVQENQSVLPTSALALSSDRKQEATIESFKDVSGHVKNLKFRLFQWPKSLMPDPYWNEERKRFYVEQYNGEDSPGYKHNVLGEDGDPEHTVFPWHQFKYCIQDIPEYRCLKILVNAGRNEVAVTGYKCSFVMGNDGPIPQQDWLLDETYMMSTFFDRGSSADDEDASSEFTRLIKSFFVSVPGAKRGGADLGFSDDVTEILITNIIGKKDRKVGRLQLKHVTYDQQCQAVNALDDIYGQAFSVDLGPSQRGSGHIQYQKPSPILSNITWGTDFGNAGSAVAHDLQGLEIYEDKNYDDRLRGFMFESTTDNISESGEEIIDAKTGKPAKITLKELATDIMVKKMQRQELEYPPDPDIILFYTNHTVRSGGKHRIYKKEDDHLIDADRVQTLAGVLGEAVEDLFA
jgi:hypothetical protein